jgi:cellulose synthase/poly-beta-1,6-N-acetylglucosamine synthase-like glycosyltransferase
MDRGGALRVLFWIAVAGCVYSYAVYPALLALLPVRRRETRPNAGSPLSVSLIIACRNEQARLRHKLDNALAVDYPSMEIIVASDASDDASDDIVREYETRGIRLVRSPTRRGKEFAQGLAIAETSGDVIVFSDAGTDLPADSIRAMVENFDDPTVGAVSSEDRFISEDGKVAGEGAYVRYEMWLRRLESQRAGLVGLSGSFFGVRRSIVRDWNASIPSDFACAMHAVRAGMRAVADPRVVGVYRDIKDPSKEFARKVRTAIRGMTAVAVMREVLNPIKYGAFAFQVWGHKIMRWLVPWFMVLLLAVSAFLAREQSWYAAALALQLLGYGTALVGALLPAARRFALVKLAYFFVQVNLALARASLEFLGGRRIVQWEPSARKAGTVM